MSLLKNTFAFPIQQLAIGGDPDFLLCMAGRFVALELKDDGEEPRPLQLYKLDKVRRTGGVAIVASPSNWQAVTYLLAKLDMGESIDDYREVLTITPDR